MQIRALYVRNMVRSWCSAIAVPPFYDTVNRTVDPEDDVWWTAEFFTRSNTNQTYCKAGYTEEGDVDLVFCSLPGIGDTSLFTAVEGAMNLFSQNVDPAGLLNIEGYEPVTDLLFGNADRWYRVAVGFRYTYAVT